MFKKICLFLLLLIAAVPALAQTAALQGHSFLGGTQATTSGLKSANYLDGIIPYATITVYLTGTQTLATIFSDAAGDHLSNPFTSNAVTSVNPGGWIFFAATNQGYDIIASGGISPNTYPAPVPLCVDCYPGFSFSPGNLLTLQHNGSSAGISQSLYNALDNGTIAPDPGFTLARFLTNSSGGWAAEYLASNLQTQAPDPLGTQSALIYPTTNVSSGGAVSTNTSASMSCVGSFGCSGVNTVFGGFAYPPGLTSSQVTAIYPVSAASNLQVGTSEPAFAGLSCSDGTTSYGLPASSATFFSLQPFSAHAVSWNPANIASFTCTAQTSASLAVSSQFNVNLIALRVYYTGTPVSQPNVLNVRTPLGLNYALNQLYIDPTAPFPGLYNLPYTIGGTLPSAANAVTGVAYFVTNASSTDTNCTAAGSSNEWCTSNGTAYTAFGNGSGAGSVTSVFGRTGAVAAVNGDYSVGQVTGAAPIASPTFTGTATTPALDLSSITGSTQCLHVNTSGVVSGTGSDCGSGSGTGTVTDGAGTTTANQIATSTTTLHQIQYGTAIPNGTTATTQTTGDNTTKVATDAFVLANASGGGCSGSTCVAYNPPATSYVIMGDSTEGVTNSCVETSLPSDTAPITAGTVSGGTGSFTGANTYTSGCVLTLSKFGAGATGLNGQPCVVSATGLSGSAFQCPVTGGAIASTGTGQAQPTYNLTGALGRESFVNGHGTVVNFATSSQTLAQAVTAYPSTAHAYSPAVTGNPGYLIIGNCIQDLYNGNSAAAMFSSLQSLLQTARPDNWTAIILMTCHAYLDAAPLSDASPSVWNTYNQLVRTAGPTNANVAAGQYWDRIADIDTLFPNDGNYIIGGGAVGHLTDLANKKVAGRLNQVLANQGSVPDGNPNFAPSLLASSWYPYAGTGMALGWDYTNQLLGGGEGDIVVFNRGGSGVPLLQVYAVGAGNTNLGSPRLTLLDNGGGGQLQTNWLEATNGGLRLDYLSSSTNPLCWNGTTVTNAGTCGASGFNGTVTYTSSQTASSSDNNKVVVMSCTSACAYTLPATQPSAIWGIQIQSKGSTLAAVALGGSATYNGVALAPALNGFRVITIAANTAISTDYVGDAPLVPGANITFTSASNGFSVAAAAAGTGLSGMTAGQVPIAATATTVTSSKPLAGSGAAIATGPTTSTNLDCAQFTGTTGQLADSGVPCGTGAGSGAGIVTYSGPSLTFSGTLFFPVGGGGLSSSTETNVDIDSPAAATVQNFAVQLSAAPGTGNSIAFTWRKNASTTTLTCTISGATATSCNDLTHNFTVAQGDLLDVQVVTTGTVVGTPTVVMGTQFGIASGGSGAIYGAAVTNSSQSIVSGSVQNLSFSSSAVRDDGGFYNFSSQPTRLTVPAGAAGWYSIVGSLNWPPINGQTGGVQLEVNGTTIIASNLFNATAIYAQNVSAVWYLNAGDYVQMQTQQFTGSTQTTTNFQLSLAQLR